jgi:membrane protein DedA with SNARE-associated domain
MITIVTLMYLPISFIAQFLSAGYVALTKEQTGGKLTLHVSENILIFIVLSVVFLAVTLGAWRVLERKHRIIDRRSATFYLQNP